MGCATLAAGVVVAWNHVASSPSHLEGQRSVICCSLCLDIHINTRATVSYPSVSSYHVTDSSWTTINNDQIEIENASQPKTKVKTVLIITATTLVTATASLLEAQMAANHSRYWLDWCNHIEHFHSNHVLCPCVRHIELTTWSRYWPFTDPSPAMCQR